MMKNVHNTFEKNQSPSDRICFISGNSSMTFMSFGGRNGHAGRSKARQSDLDGSSSHSHVRWNHSWVILASGADLLEEKSVQNVR